MSPEQRVRIALDPYGPMAEEAGRRARALVTARLAGGEAFSDELARLLNEVFGTDDLAPEEQVSAAGHLLAALAFTNTMAVRYAAALEHAAPEEIMSQFALEMVSRRANI